MHKWDETDLAALKANPNIHIHVHERKRRNPEGFINHANRGITLERLVEMANIQYAEMGRAFIWKPGTQVKFLPGGKIIPQKTTVDFIGCLQNGQSVAFDCKSTQTNTLPAGNVEEHQVEFLRRHWEMNGLSFLLVGFMKHGRYFVVHIREYLPLWTGRKGLKLQDAIEIGREVRRGETCLDYL